MPTDVIEVARPRKRGLAPEIRRLKTTYPELSHGAIARKVGCTVGNVSTVVKHFLNGKSPRELQEFQENKADVYDALQHSCLASITSSKLAKTSAAQLATMAAILEDKSRLVRGQATSLNVNVLLDVAEAIRAKR